MEGRRRLQKTLDEMTKLVAEEEVSDAECFSDVISFDVEKDVKFLLSSGREAHRWLQQTQTTARTFKTSRKRLCLMPQDHME